MTMKIAFIGLGNMGGGMAANLVKAGHLVQAFDLAEAALEQARTNGCAVFAMVREAVAGVEAVVSMLPNGAIVETVYGTDVIGHAPPSALLIDCSTIDVTTARKVAADAAGAGYAMVDAPVSGGIAAANAGTGSENLQQHAARRVDDRDVRDVCACRKARARPADFL